MTGVTGKGRLTNDEQETIKISIKSVIEKYKLTSSIDIASKVKEEYAIDVSRQYVTKVLEGLSRDIKYVFTVDERKKLSEYNTIIKEMQRVSQTAKLDADRIKAHNTMLKAIKTRNEMEFQLIAQKLIATEATRPNWLIHFTPTSAVYKCSKCGYTTYIEGDGKGGWVEVNTTVDKKQYRRDKQDGKEQDKRQQDVLKELDKATGDEQAVKQIVKDFETFNEAKKKNNKDSNKTKEKPYRL